VTEGDLFVTEFMANPAGTTTAPVADSDGEYFEVYNASGRTINMSGWTIADDGSDSYTVDGDLLVEPGSYTVFGNNGDYDTNGGVMVDYEYGTSMYLANAEDEIMLMVGDLLVSSLWYEGTSAGIAQGFGGTDYAGSMDWGNWCDQMSMMMGGDYGTPGVANDSCIDLTCADGGGITGDFSGDTTGASNDWDSACYYSMESGADTAYYWTPAEDACYVLTAGDPTAAYEPVLSLWSGCEDDAMEVDCASAYDAWDGYISAELQVEAYAGETQIVVVDSYRSDVAGAFDFTAAIDETGVSYASEDDLGDATGTWDLTLTEDSYDGSCSGYPGALDIIVDWTAPADGCFTFDTEGSEISDSKMALLSDGMCGATELECDDDGGTGYLSMFTADVTEGSEYQIFVGAYSTSVTGGAVLSITEGCP
jgi:hypothetical protein